MEYYKYDYELFYNSYRKFIASAKIRVINAEDEFLSTIEGEAIRLYPSKDITDIKFLLIDDEPFTSFTLKDLGTFNVWGFGEHIAVDASLAILAALESMDVETIRIKLLHFQGIKKRFDIISKGEKAIIIDDYGHHPCLIILPVWAASEAEQFIDFKHEFSAYDLKMMDYLKRDGENVNLVKHDEVIETLDEGLIIGFGAGDITYQLRGEK
jgi:UDP-N-acetylmuramate--alanine ligase